MITGEHFKLRQELLGMRRRPGLSVLGVYWGLSYTKLQLYIKPNIGVHFCLGFYSAQLLIVCQICPIYIDELLIDLGVRWIPFSSKFNEAIVQQKQSESFFFRVLAFWNFRARVFHIGARNTDSIKKKYSARF